MTDPRLVPQKDATFDAVFGRAAGVRAFAPGRVNLIGEHTDYHEGFVLPATVPQHTRVELAARPDTVVRAWSANMPTAPIEFELGREMARGEWIDYVQGITHGLAAAGFEVPGFDLLVDSNVPVGAGLSSSAALEVSLLRGLRTLCGWAIDDVEIARLGQRAEAEFVGAPVGIMDQMAASVGRPGEALLLDTRSLEVQRISLPAAGELLVIDSGIAHQHARGEYAARRRQSFEAAARLGVSHLRDVGIDAWPRIEALPPPLDRRARHIVSENARVLEAAAALRSGDLSTLGALFNASHASMRDDYEISTPEIDALVAIAQSDARVFGARLTGGGFGGSIVVLTRPGEAAAVEAHVREEYRRLGA